MAELDLDTLHQVAKLLPMPSHLDPDYRMYHAGVEAYRDEIRRLLIQEITKHSPVNLEAHWKSARLEENNEKLSIEETAAVLGSRIPFEVACEMLSNSPDSPLKLRKAINKALEERSQRDDVHG